MESRILWALPAVFLAAGLAAEPPQLRLKSLTGQQRLGTTVEVVEGEAVYESDIHATVWASAGGAFSYETEDGLIYVSAVRGKGPVEVDWAGARLRLIDGGRVALMEGGVIVVERAGVEFAAGSELAAGESLTVGIEGRSRAGLMPGDILSLNVPVKRPFMLAAGEPMAEPTFEPLTASAPMPGVSTPMRKAKPLRSKKAVPLMVARAVPTSPEPLPASEQSEMRMAVAPMPKTLPAPPPGRFLVEGVPPTGTLAGDEAPRLPGRLTRNQWGLVGLITATAALIGLELWRRQDD